MTAAAAPPAVRRQRLIKTAAYYVACVALGLVTASLGPTLPGLAAHVGAPLTQISFLFTARSLGYLLGASQGGRLYDYVPGHKLMGGALALTALFMLFVPLARVAWLLLVLWLLIGLVEGSVDAGVNTLIVWVHGREVGPFMQALHFFFGVGAFVSPLIIGAIVQRTGDINWADWIIALSIVPMAVWIWALPSPSHHEARAAQKGRGSNGMLVALIALLLFFYVGMEASYGGWIYSYATAMGLGNVAGAAYLTSAFWGALTVGRLAAVPLSARFRPMTLLVADLVGGVLSVALVLLFPHSLLAIWVGTIALGLSIASIFATALLLAERRMAITGTITGWFFVGGSSGGMTIPLIIGQLFERVGPRVTMMVILIDLLLAIGILFILGRVSKASELDTGVFVA